jgi:hypothetical protein
LIKREEATHTTNNNNQTTTLTLFDHDVNIKSTHSSLYIICISIQYIYLFLSHKDPRQFH